MQEDANREAARPDGAAVTTTSQAHQSGRRTQRLVWAVAVAAILLIAVAAMIR